MFNAIKNKIIGVAQRLQLGVADTMSPEKFVVREIETFLASKRRQMMVDGERYYDGNHDILHKKRMAIGRGGHLEEIANLPNNKIVDNQYKKMVDQKANYLVGKPVTIKSENKQYAKEVSQIIDKRFQRSLKNISLDALNGGLGWLYVYYDNRGELCTKRFKPFEIIPGWRDADKTDLEYAIRVYDSEHYVKSKKKTISKVEVYASDGIHYYEIHNGSLVPVEPFFVPYISLTKGSETATFAWEKIPLIPFRYNEREIPLLKSVKSLQDGVNQILSSFQDNMEEDARNTIMVLVNYEGQDLGEFRRNLAQYGAVKVRSIEGVTGDVKTLQVEVNADNYKAILEIFKKAIIENANGYDAKDERMSGNPNQMNIQSMYSDIDLDASGMETEFQASMEELIWFINCHLANTGKGDFEGEQIDVIFNRDMMMSESDIINNCRASVGILSDETIIANHPWTTDPQIELKKIKAQKEADAEQYGDIFGKQEPDPEEDDE